MNTLLHSPGDTLNGRYKIINFIGEGGMQQVFKTTDLAFDRTVVLKTPKNDLAKKRFRKSAIMSAKINHPNVAKTFDYFSIKDRDYLIEEFVEGTDLKKGIANVLSIVDPYLGARIFHHLAKGVAASHHANVIHRDLKPSNILISGGFNLNSIKITDFGIARLAKGELIAGIEGGDETMGASSTVMGALPYMSPELIDNPKEAGLATDIWSLGALMYHLLFNIYPFGVGLKAVPNIKSGKIPEIPDIFKNFSQFSHLVVDIYNIIKKCLNLNLNKRIKGDDLVKECESLYYPINERHIGIVREKRYNAWGFISNNNKNIFF